MKLRTVSKRKKSIIARTGTIRCSEKLLNDKTYESGRDGINIVKKTMKVIVTATVDMYFKDKSGWLINPFFLKAMRISLIKKTIAIKIIAILLWTVKKRKTDPLDINEVEKVVKIMPNIPTIIIAALIMIFDNVLIIL